MISKLLITATALLAGAFANPAGEHATGALPTPESVRHVPELAWHAAGGESACTVSCWDNHEWVMHAAISGGNTNQVEGGSHETAFAGLCASKHPGCGGEENLIESAEGIQAAIDARDVEALKELLEQQAGKVYLAVERSALQVTGCRGEIVGHFRVPADLQRALTE